MLCLRLPVLCTQYTIDLHLYVPFLTRRLFMGDIRKKGGVES